MGTDLYYTVLKAPVKDHHMNFGVDDIIVFCLHMSLFCLCCQCDSQQFIALLICSGFVIACASRFQSNLRLCVMRSKTVLCVHDFYDNIAHCIALSGVTRTH